MREVVYYNDAENAYNSDGVLEALTAAKQRGNVRFVGFTGHKNPSIHLEMLNRGFHFDAVQMPINPFDPGVQAKCLTDCSSERDGSLLDEAYERFRRGDCA